MNGEVNLQVRQFDYEASKKSGLWYSILESLFMQEENILLYFIHLK